jgi:N-acetylglucosaminyl-diphospho-decaprenol L-rhamnosyltransferase
MHLAHKGFLNCCACCPREIGYGVLSIVIITRNTKEILRELLHSIEDDSSINPLLRETVVVDNGSTDGTASMVAERFPWVTQIHNAENLGFAAAVNKGYGHTYGDFVLFLNSDTRLIPGELLKMVQHLERNREIGIIGPQLVYEDMRLQRSFAPAPSLTLEILPKFLLETLFPRRFGAKGAWAQSSVDVESLIGAAILVRREVLDLLAGFDERFFFFLEETDLCLRTRHRGYRVVFFPESRLIHLQGKTVKKSWIPGRLEYAISLYKFVQKHHSVSYYAVFVGVRFTKGLLSLFPPTILPFLFFGDSIRRRYFYYLRLVSWHFRGCPDNAGLRP